MARLEPMEEPSQQKKTKNVRKKQGSTSFFVFVDYLFLLVFIGFLCFILYKMFSI